MKTQENLQCCPPFDPGPWSDREIVWQDKMFLQTHVRSFLHVPLNFGAVMKRSMAAVCAADAADPQQIVLSDEKSSWGADVFVATTKPVPGEHMAALSGTFLTRVFEGPYRDMRKWIEEMKRHVAEKGKTVKKLYFYYTACPKCAKKYGHNYIVILAQV